MCKRTCSHYFSTTTAQVAERQGRYLAKALSHQPSASQHEPEPFVFKPWGMLAYVGGYQALHDTPYDKSHGELHYEITPEHGRYYSWNCTCINEELRSTVI